MQLIIYETVVVFVLLFAMEFTKKATTGPNLVNGRQYDYSRFLFYCFAIAIIVPSAFRNGYSDTANYKGLFTSGGNDFANAYNGKLPFEFGYSLFQIFLHNIDSNPQFLVFVTSVFIVSLDIYYINKYSSDLPFSFFLYFVLTYMTSMNGIRQSMAAIVLTLALPWIMEKKPIRYMALVLLMSTFHKSALIMIPLYFVLSGKRLNLGVYIVLFIAIVSAFYPTPLYYALGFILEDSGYTHYLYSVRGMNVFRLFSQLVPTALVCFSAKSEYNRDTDNTRLIDVLVNMQLVTFAFSIISMQMIFFSRAAAYMRGTTCITLPLAIDRVFEGKNKIYVKMAAIVLYIVFWVIDIKTSADYHQWDVFYLNWSLF